MNLKELITELSQIKQLIKELDSQRSELKAQENDWTLQIIQRMKEEGATRTAIDGVGSVSVIDEPVPNVHDWDTAHDYIFENRLVELLHRRISAKAFREYLESGNHVPGIEIRNLTKLNFRSN